MNQNSSIRIKFLDGYRGLAILLVILFHAFSRWSNILPYGDKYSNIVIFKYGFLGVELFFLISGFVILMTLEKTETFKVFIFKRWVRLFPAMLLASGIIYFTGKILPDRPHGIPELSSVIPGLLFVNPKIFNIAFNTEIYSLDGSFWSLYVEVKFYLIFGLLYYIVGRSKAVAFISLSYLALLVSYLFDIQILRAICNLFSFQYFGWFASGSLAYIYVKEGNNRSLILSVIIGLLSCLYFYFNQPDAIVYSVLIVGIFFVPLIFERTRIILSSRFLLFLGFISYPLYLIHQYLMLALIVKYKAVLHFIPDYLLFLPAVILLSITSYIIALHLEPRLKTFILDKLIFIQNKLNFKN